MHDTQSRPAQGLLHKISLDAQTSEPYYLQLKRQINALIASGELPAGSSLPSERVLADALQVSRTTVKRCYNDLRDEQQLRTHGRGGTQVQAPRSPALVRRQGFTAEMKALGLQASSQLLERTRIKDHRIAELFGAPPTRSFLKIVRLRLADQVPLAREQAWFDLDLVPAMAHWDGLKSTTEFLRAHSAVPLAQAEQTIEAVLSQPNEDEVFGFAAPAPCLLLKRKITNSSGQTVAYAERTFRGDAYAYRHTVLA